MTHFATYVFAASFGREDARGPFALGCGESVSSANLDALGRLRGRFDVASLRADPVLQALELELLKGTAAVVFERPGEYPSQEQMGHNYMTNETMFAAAAFTGGAEDVAKAQSLEEPTPVALGQLFGRRLKKDVYWSVEPALVDWYEVMLSFRPDAVTQLESDAKREGGASEGASGDAQEPVVISGRRIDDDVIAVLRQCTVDGHNVVLPEGRMDRKLYERVNEVLVGLGGKWVGRKVQAHVFEESPEVALDVAIGTAGFTKPQDFGYFPTPADLARRVVDMAGIEPGMKVLEPSAGTGSLAILAAKATGNVDLVTLVEMLPGNARKLREAGFSAVNQVDFLTLSPVPIFDRVVMNPPFAGGADIAHVQHAARFLKPDGRLVSITSPSWTFRKESRSESFRDFVQACSGEVHSVAGGAFAESGTNIATRIVSLEASRFPWNLHESAQEDDEDVPVLRERQRA